MFRRDTTAKTETNGKDEKLKFRVKIVVALHSPGVVVSTRRFWIFFSAKNSNDSYVDSNEKEIIALPAYNIFKRKLE